MPRGVTPTTWRPTISIEPRITRTEDCATDSTDNTEGVKADSYCSLPCPCCPCNPCPALSVACILSPAAQLEVVEETVEVVGMHAQQLRCGGVVLIGFFEGAENKVTLGALDCRVIVQGSLPAAITG